MNAVIRFLNPYFTNENRTLSFYLIRLSVHIFVLLSLLIHQFLFQDFVAPLLSIGIYGLCSFVFLTDSLSLFFFREDKVLGCPRNLILLFTDAVFLSSLIMITGPVGLVFVLTGAIMMVLPLFVLDRLFLGPVFLLYLSILFPVFFLWEGNVLAFDFRWSSVIFINFLLFFIFVLGVLLFFIFNGFQQRKTLYKKSYDDESFYQKSFQKISLSLDLVRQLKPILNSLVKYFPEQKKALTETHSVPAHIFANEKGRHLLQKLKNFISDFIEYAELEPDFFLKDTIDLKNLIQDILQKLETHSQRPERLIQNMDWSDGCTIKGSLPHLKKCFEHIFINSFEALKNQNNPEITVQGKVEKFCLNLKCSDNGHGIETENMKKLFHPLFSTRFGGLRGLGLPYVQKILKAHKASLNITSSKKGTTIFIKFPLMSYNNPLNQKLAPKQKKVV